jgi:hypothetical protein
LQNTNRPITAKQPQIKEEKEMERFGKIFWRKMFFVAIIGLFAMAVLMLTTTVSKLTAPKIDDTIKAYASFAGEWEEIIWWQTLHSKYYEGKTYYDFIRGNFKLSAISVCGEDSPGDETNRTKMPRGEVLLCLGQSESAHSKYLFEQLKSGKVAIIHGTIIPPPGQEKGIMAIDVNGITP